MSYLGVMGMRRWVYSVQRHIWSVQILRPYPERKHFVLYTDHQTLKWLLNLSDASSRLARWRLRLLEFYFTVKHKRGTWNIVADAVSRLATCGSTPVDPDLDVPGLMVETKAPLSIIAAVDTASWTELDTEPEDGSAPVLFAEPAEVTPISLGGDSCCTSN